LRCRAVGPAGVNEVIESDDVSHTVKPPEAAPGVIGNARITGTFGAVIFVLLFLEGLTVLRVGSLISMHVFVGMLLVPFVVVKIASTGYRFVRYYGGRAAYTDKGPPPLLLRCSDPSSSRPQSRFLRLVSARC